MARGGTRFEVQVYKTDHWVLSDMFEDEAAARAHGRTLIGSGRIEGIRILKDWRRPDGRHIESEIHTEFRAVSKAIVIAPIDEPPRVCTELSDFYGVESRITMNRLLRNYTERMVVTPTEILHNHAELKRLLDKDNLLASAVGRVAALQADKAGLDGRKRRDELFGVVNTLTERARAAAGRSDLPDLSNTGYAEAFEALMREPPEDRDFLAKVVLSRDLVRTRNWLGKLDRLGELAQRDGVLPAEPLGVLDGVMADVLGAPSVAQELLGVQGSLAEALCTLVDLSRGRLQPGGRGDDDRALHLSELLAFHDLGDTRAVIVDLVRRQLKGTVPLRRSDPSGEKDAFREVLERTVGPSGVVGGPGMAEALIQRYLRFLEAGGATGRRQAMAEVTACLPNGRDRVRFLLALAGSETGRQHREDVVGLLDRTTGDGAALAQFVDASQPIKTNLEELTRLYADAAEASVLPAADRDRLADRVDGLLVRYIEQTRVVERLDNPSDLLRHRANRLMLLCTPGTLQSRKALDVVRRRVIEHLRQPNFEHRYIEDIADPILQRKALRDFYKLLGEAGFR